MIGTALLLAAVVVAPAGAFPGESALMDAERACQIAAARKWDDGVSDAATIAKIVDEQCYQTLRDVALAEAKSAGFDANSNVFRTVLSNLASVVDVGATRIVLRQRVDAHPRR